MNSRRENVPCYDFFEVVNLSHFIRLATLCAKHD